MLELISAVVAGFIGGTLGSISGGGGLLTIPYLLVVGLPIDSVIATNRLVGLGVVTGSIGNFKKNNKINLKLVPILSILAIGGGLIGANIVLGIDDKMLETVAGFILLLLLPTIFFNKDFGLKGKTTGLIAKSAGFLLYLFAMVFGGFFGAGAGIFLNYILVNFFGFKLIKAVATNMVAWAFMSATAFVIFAFSGLIDYRIGSCMAVGGLLGGYTGSKLAIERGDGFVKLVMVIVILATSAKLLLF